MWPLLGNKAFHGEFYFTFCIPCDQIYKTVSDLTLLLEKASMVQLF